MQTVQDNINNQCVSPEVAEDYSGGSQTPPCGIQVSAYIMSAMLHPFYGNYMYHIP
jgi:hypothetical protein